MEMKRTNDLVISKYREYFLTTFAMSGCTSMASIVDRIMVGKLLGSNELAATNLVIPFVSIINMIFCLFIYGGNTLAVTYKGKCDNRKADKCFTISIGIGFAFMALLGAIGILFWRPITGLLVGNNTELFNPVYDYMFPQFFLGIMVIIVNGLSAYIRVDGLRKLALFIPIVVNVVNVLFDFIFMGLMKLGIMSAGFATIIGYLVGIIMIIPYFKSKKRSVKFTKIGVKDIKLIIELLYTGMPTGFLHLCIFVNVIVMNSVILAAEGTVGMQVMSVCISSFNLVNIFLWGTSQTLLPITGALNGEQDIKGIKGVLKFSLKITEIFCVIMFLLFELFPAQIGAVFGAVSLETVELLVPAMRIYCFGILISGIELIIRSFYQASGHKNTATAMSVLDGVGLFVPLIYLLAWINPHFIWLSFPLTPLLTTLIILGVMQYRAKKSGMTNFLMLKEEQDAICFEFSIENKIDHAVKASAWIIERCRENAVPDNLGNLLGIACEELCTNIAQFAYGEKSKMIDIFLKIYNDKIVLKIRDDGCIFNPTEYVDETGREITGLKVLNKLPAKVIYNRVIGFNTTIVMVGKTQ